MQQSGDCVAAKDCWERAATGHLAQKSPWHAAKALERAGEMARDAKDWPEVKACFERSSELCLEEGRPATAAEALIKAAKALEEPEPSEATELYLRGIYLLEDCGKGNLAGETFRSAIAHSVRNQKWSNAAMLSMRFAASCDAAGADHSQCKAYLGAIVIWLYAEDASQAWATYQDALAVTKFSSSDEAFAAEAVIEAYGEGVDTAVKDAVKFHHAFSHLDNCVARLAKKLPAGDVVAMSEVLGGHGRQAGFTSGDGHAEEDLT